MPKPLSLTKTYTPYDRYADSGVPWLGQVPEGWEVLKIKSLVQILNGATPKSDKIEYWDGDINWVTPVDLSKLNSKFIKETSRKITQQGYLSCGTKIIPKNNIVISCRAPIGLLAINTESTCTNQGCKGLILNNKTNTKYLFYLLSSLVPIIQLHGNGSTFSEIKNNDLGSIAISIPPLPTQQRITTYLDEKTEKIDRIIAGKKRLVELLEEKRKSVISEAVEGVDGVKREKLKFVADINPSNVDKKSDENEINIQLANYTDVYNHEFIISSMNFMKATATIDQIKKFGLKKGDVIITKDSESWDDIAIPAYVPENLDGVVCGYHLALIRPKTKKILGSYLFRLLQSKNLNDKLCISSNGITRFGLSIYPIKNVEIEYPPIDKQIEIAREIDTKTIKIDNTIKKVKQSIQLLTEYKSSLISHVVTGRVKV